jgi:hypothetical protein
LWRKFGMAVNGTESGTWRNILIDISWQMAAVIDSVTEAIPLFELYMTSVESRN